MSGEDEGGNVKEEPKKQGDEVIGFVNFDSGLSDSNEVELTIPYGRISSASRGKYIRILTDDKRNFLARISKGPFYETNAISKDSAYAKVSILEAENNKILTPEYHGTCFVRLMGELDMANLTVTGSSARPKPQARAIALTSDEIEGILAVGGHDMYLGRLKDYSDVHVTYPSNLMRGLPRNVGIFGTIGSGKTNTSQVLIEEASTHNWTVIILDVEGEYVRMDQASEQRYLPFQKFGIEPEGLEDFQVYHPSHGEATRNDSTEFGIPFGSIPPFIYSEMLEFSGPQQRHFEEAYTAVAARTQNAAAAGVERQNLLEGLDGNNDGVQLNVTLDLMMHEVRGRLATAQGADRSSWSVLLQKLRTLERRRVFDQHPLNIQEDLLQANTAHVIDFSDASDEQVNNLAIYHLLNGIFNLKQDHRDLPNVLIVIEEASYFVSREKASRMHETLVKLKEMARRGRKRWMSLCFVSQFPSHLPSEIYELCNTKFVHQMTGGKNLDAIKQATGGVDPAVWDDIPNLSEGECLVVSPIYKNRPIFCQVRPCKTKRLHVEGEGGEEDEGGNANNEGGN